MTADIEVEVEDDAWLAVPDCVALVEAAAWAALESDPRPSTRDPRPSITVLLTDDDEVRALNRDHRRQDKPTNVLSFPAHATAVGHLGDLALAYGVCAREADEQGKPLANHLQHLVVHGVLHLTGHDHAADAEADAMEARERGILAGLNIPDPYATQ